MQHEEICGECRKSLPWIKEPCCKKCGKPIQNDRAEYCYDCTVKRHMFEEGRSLWIHQSPVSDAVYAFKYQNRRIYGKIFGKEMAKKYGSFLEHRQVALIVPIPLHKKRRRRRGYNQAELAARVLSEQTGIPMDTEVLVRVKATKPQKALGNKERYGNIQGAFAYRKRIWC